MRTANPIVLHLEGVFVNSLAQCPFLQIMKDLLRRLKQGRLICLASDKLDQILNTYFPVIKVLNEVRRTTELLNLSQVVSLDSVEELLESMTRIYELAVLVDSGDYSLRSVPQFLVNVNSFKRSLPRGQVNCFLGSVEAAGLEVPFAEDTEGFEGVLRTLHSSLLI